MIPEESLQQAIEHHNAGRLQEAGEVYLAILKDDPRHAVANHNMGMLAIQMDQPAAGLPYLETALDIDPARAQFWLSYIDALQRAGQLDDARQVLALARQQGLEGAEVDALDASLNAPAAPSQTQMDQFMMAFNQGRYAEAAALASTLTQQFPEFSPAWYFLGNALGTLGHLPESEAAYRFAIHLNPDFIEAHHNLGSTLKDLRRLDEAEASYRRAIQLKPDLADAWLNLGNTLKDLGKLVDAATCCRRGLEIAPGNAALQQGLANHLAHLSDFTEVVDRSNAALQRSPNNAQLWEQRLYTFSYHPDLTDQQIFAEFVRWGDRFPPPLTDFSAHDRTPGRRLRIGFVSPDFRRHSSRVYFWPMFANHDHTVVEMFAYSNVLNEDEATAKFKTVFNHWRNIRGVADADVARMIRDDRIDILVDGCNHMLDDRLGVFALKPAPIQATWLGAAWTTGLKQIDYVLFDPHIAPPGTLTRESIVRLPRCFIAYQPENQAPVAPTPALKNGTITFGYSGRTERLNHHTFRVWGEILRRVPNSRLILDYRAFADPATQQHYHQFMQQHGMDPQRVIMRRSADIFSGLNDFDVLLDSFPHSSGTMALDALWMSVPMLTLAGRPPVGRIGTTFMTQLGMSEWIAHSHDDYINKAVALTKDIHALNAVRASVRPRFQASIMDGQRFAHEVEAAYRWMYDAWITTFAESNRVADDANRYFDQAIEHKNAGRLEDAVMSYRQALKRDPTMGAAYYNLGNTLAALGQLEAAVDNFQHAAQRIPANALVFNNLGATQYKLHQHDAAEISLRQALRIDPACVDAHYNLGNTLRAQERYNEARQCYEQALQLQPNAVEARNGLAALLLQQGESLPALPIIMQSLRMIESAEAKTLFVACIKNLQLTQAGDDVRTMLVRALTEPWGRPAELLRVAIDLIKLTPDLATSLVRSTDPLLLAALTAAPVCDVAMERLLTATRRELLNYEVKQSNSEASLDFLGTLATQCFINEYVFACSDAETPSTQLLRERVEHVLETGTPLTEQSLLVLATYLPLHAVKHAARILERSWSTAVLRVITQQLREPAEEQRLRATLPQLTPIADRVSLEVQQQYEENPYPRWIKSARLDAAKPLQEYLRDKFPLVAINAHNIDTACEILVAGCGTGQHPITTSQRIAHTKVLAIDLSRSSLAYAKRKAMEMGIATIEFAQADLLQLGTLGRTFDVIESVGVLHHLADPWTGWRALLALLRPGGFMKLGFYSELARRDVVRIRNEIAINGYASTPTGISACRQSLMQQGDHGRFASILASPDFFSTSACRDLLFHVQEHRLKLEQIQAFLREQQLQFLGFELEDRQLQEYRARFPNDRAATNLEQWNIFEEEHPYTFGNMYQFWVQKPSA